MPFLTFHTLLFSLKQGRNENPHAAPAVLSEDPLVNLSWSGFNLGEKEILIVLI